MRLPLWFLRRDTTKLHTDAEPDIVGVPEEHASAGPLHAQFEGGLARRDHAAAPRRHQLRHHHTCDAVQEGLGRVHQGAGACHLLIGAPQQYAGNGNGVLHLKFEMCINSDLSSL